MLEVRDNFALQHLLAAARFARHCHRVETENANKNLGPFFSEITSYASASVLSAVAALEANINESFIDLKDGTTKKDDLDIHALKVFWKDIERLKILNKYDKYLQLTVKSGVVIDKGIKEYQSVKILIDVRNALVHFKPEWRKESKNHDKISRKLMNKFDLSPFTTKNSPIFPMSFMTHGLAEWAVKSVLDFNMYFTSVANIPNKFSKFKDQLRTVSN